MLKIETGYNIGSDIFTINDMKEVGYFKTTYKIPEKEFLGTPNLPKLNFLEQVEP